MAKKDDSKAPSKARKSTKRKSAYTLKDSASESTEETPADDAAAASTPEATRETTETAGSEGFNFMNTAVGRGVQNTIRQYVVENMVPEGQTTGNVDLNLDADFVKNHLPGLATALWQSVASTVVPPNLSLSVPVPEAVDEPEPTTSESTENAATSGSGMSLNVDVAGMLRNLFQPKGSQAEGSTNSEDSEEDDT